jgi:membrane protein
VLFTLGRSLFGLYLAHSGTVNLFRVAGSLSVLMMWLYFSAAVFLVGAEIAAALTRHAQGPTATRAGDSHVARQPPASQKAPELR